MVATPAKRHAERPPEGERPAKKLAAAEPEEEAADVSLTMTSQPNSERALLAKSTRPFRSTQALSWR
ncbi:hypothetical protein Agabi119p4_9481 [Agaricus bisporus var. burnettii]|uniref:Uncharacterized protein n=1 Tax=Agaricus bisporus var. burnettii TaxID=192524 RepID=A0A8H7C2H6_AGABI|nr:hypothetical protein Agabi119p4_9481 [Agaricus bisporus var. burnettii]